MAGTEWRFLRRLAGTETPEEERENKLALNGSKRGGQE
jgi:hypothetical protein